MVLGGSWVVLGGVVARDTGVVFAKCLGGHRRFQKGGVVAWYTGVVLAKCLGGHRCFQEGGVVACMRDVFLPNAWVDTGVSKSVVL